MTVAAASNFAAAAREIAADFEASSGFDARVSTASTGKLYAQIVNGAPFDVLLAADSDRPQRLEASMVGVSGTRFTYAIGTLVLWSRQVDDCRGVLANPGDIRIAIANPQTAPYGTAAQQYMERTGLWQAARSRLVTGDNIAQALHFVASGNAEIGFIAGAQMNAPSLPAATCAWPVPDKLHDPIEQQAILLRRGAGNRAAAAFLSYLQGEEGRGAILRHGYRLPGGNE